MNFQQSLRPVLLFSVFLLLVSCAHQSKQEEFNVDPYESYNRKIYAFNAGFDKYFFHPVAKTYYRFTPYPIRQGISNFFDNVRNVPTIANDLLQLEFKQAMGNTWRLLINSTFGLVGFVDVADHIGLSEKSNDFGITLGKYGYTNSRYIVWPFIGPSTVRDTVGYGGNYFMGIWPYIDNTWGWGLYGGSLIDTRARLISSEDTFRVLSDIEEYSFVRSVYLQYRNNAILGQRRESEDFYKGIEDWNVESGQGSNPWESKI